MDNGSANCFGSVWYRQLTEGVFVATYNVLAPIEFVFGLAGHVIFLAVCFKRRKSEKAYHFHIILVVTEILYEISAGMYNFMVALYGLSGAERNGAAADWISSLYVPMWYYAKLGSPLMGIFVTACQILSACMSVDRMLALARPLAYTKYNHKRHECMAVAATLFISILSNIIDCFRKTAAESSPGRYKIVNEAQQVQSETVEILHQLRNFLPAISLIVLIVCNILIIHLYRVKNRRVQAMVSTERDEERRRNEKTIICITLLQSTLNFMAVVFSIIYRALFVVYPNMTVCGSYVMVPIQHCVYMLAYGFDFYIMLLLSSQFRRMVRQSIFIRN